jgi:hypothetical protein
VGCVLVTIRSNWRRKTKKKWPLSHRTECFATK